MMMMTMINTPTTNKTIFSFCLSITFFASYGLVSFWPIRLSVRLSGCLSVGRSVRYTNLLRTYIDTFLTPHFLRLYCRCCCQQCSNNNRKSIIKTTLYNRIQQQKGTDIGYIYTSMNAHTTARTRTLRTMIIIVRHHHLCHS